MKQSFDPAGFWLSEKLDGARCIYDWHENFMSRNGHLFRCPEWFKVGMPAHRLDGELYAGHGGFDFLVSEIQRKKSDWRKITFEIFDLAELHQPIESRLAALAKLPLPSHCRLVPQRVCGGAQDVDDTETAIVAAGGEGLCLRPPRSHYQPGNFIKIKRLHADLNRDHLD